MNNQKPKTIKISLADGEPTGTKIVELSNWTGIAYLIPRNRLENTLNNPENRENLNSQCVYFLIGDSEENQKTVYVGEAEEFSKRIIRHNKNNKDFWNLVMVFTSKDDNLTKAHVKYLESKIVQQIKNNNTVKLQNENVPPLPKLPRTDIHQMDEFYENMKILASALGFTFLENFNDKLDEQEEILYCKGKNYDAIGLYTDEGFIILEGSIVSGKHSPSFEKYEYGRLKRREKTIEDGSLVPEENGNNVVKRKLIFSSPSAASGFVKGGATNGWLHWKNKDGKTLDELKRRRS